MNYTRPDATFPAIAESGVRAALSPAEIGAGWSTTSQTRPPADDFNAHDYYTSAAMKYLCQVGVAEYSATEQYRGLGLCIGSNGSVYWNLVACKGIDPVTDVTGKWEKTAIRRADCAELIGNVTGGVIPETTNLLKGNGLGSAAATSLIETAEGSLMTTGVISFLQAGPTNDSGGTAAAPVARLVLGIRGQSGVSYPGGFVFNTYSATVVNSSGGDTLDIRHNSGGPDLSSGALWSINRQGTMVLHSGGLIVAGAVTALDTSKSNVTINVTGGQPSMSFVNVFGPLDAKISDVYQDSAGALHYRFINDNIGVVKSWMQVTRSGVTPTGIGLYADVTVVGALKTNGLNAAGGVSVGGPGTSTSSWFATDQNVTYFDAIGLAGTRSWLIFRQATVGGANYINSLLFDNAGAATFAAAVTAPTVHINQAVMASQVACTNIAWQSDTAYYDSFGAGGSRGKFSFRIGEANGTNTLEAIGIAPDSSTYINGTTLIGGRVLIGDRSKQIWTAGVPCINADNASLVLNSAGGPAGSICLNWDNVGGTNGVIFGNGTGDNVPRASINASGLLNCAAVSTTFFSLPSNTNNLEISQDGGSTFIDGGAGGRLLLNSHRSGGSVEIFGSTRIAVAGKIYAAPALRNYTGQRGFDAQYQNTSGMTICVSFTATTNGGSVGWTMAWLGASAGAMSQVWVNENTASVNGAEVTNMLMVPPGWFYQFSKSGNITGVGRYYEWDCP